MLVCYIRVSCDVSVPARPSRQERRDEGIFGQKFACLIEIWKAANFYERLGPGENVDSMCQ